MKAIRIADIDPAKHVVIDRDLFEELLDAAGSIENDTKTIPQALWEKLQNVLEKIQGNRS